MIEEPQGPRYLPNNPARQEPIKDKNTINKYIFYINQQVLNLKQHKLTKQNILIYKLLIIGKSGIRTHDIDISYIKI